MINLFVDGSRYVMAILMVFYTYLNFRYFGVDEERKRRLCKRQNRLMFLIHFLAYAVIYLKTEDLRMVVFYAAQVLFFLVYILFYRVLYRNVSRILVNNVCMLLCVGFIILARLSLDKAIRQFVILVISAVVTWVVPVIVARESLA